MKAPGRCALLRLLAILVASTAGTAEAQNQSRLPLPPDDVRSVLAAGERALVEEDYADAVERLQQILDHGEDYFDPEAAGESLKGRVEDHLGGLSTEGRAVYERLYGPTARSLYEEAVAGRDRAGLREVVRRFFWTDAGRDATLALADRLSDEGDMPAAANLFDRLSAHPAVGRSLRSKLLLRSAFCWWVAGTGETSEIRLAERGELLASGGVNRLPGDDAPDSIEDALAWLSLISSPVAAGEESASHEVTVFRGNGRRNGSSETAVPVGGPAWEYPAVDEFDVWSPDQAKAVRDRMAALEKQYRDADGPRRMLLPAGSPLIARDLAVMRGHGTLKAVSLETGELRWASVNADETFHHLVNRNWNPEEEWHTQNLDLFLAQRMWRDATSASLSTDGKLVFAIFDGGMASPLSQMAVNMPDLSQHPLAPHPYNRLVAYELEYGRIQWEAGGPSGPFDEPLAGVYFLGPPLPLHGSLYCIVEDRGQVRLVVLDGSSGDVQWSQPLYNPDVNVSSATYSHERRLAGLTPSVQGDVVICPTGEATVVAVDRIRRRLLWVNEYRKQTPSSPQQQALKMRMLMMVRQGQGSVSLEQQLIEELLQTRRWADTAPVIAGGLLVLTPSDSDDLHCLRIADGEEVWRRPRGEAWYVACIHAGEVILVGQRQVESLRLSNGEPAWESGIPIPAPSGRGFRHGDHYVLPLSTGEVATINLKQGRIVARSKVDSGEIPGNLVGAGGRIVSQTASGLYSFFPLAALEESARERLAANADDAEALAMRGEIRLHRGEEAAALDDLRRSDELRANPRVRELIVTALIEGLRTDFPNYRESAAEIERLTSDERRRPQFLRIFAEGLQRSGEIEAAFQQYLEFAGEHAAAGEMQRIDSLRSVRADRWIRGRLEALAERADADQQARLKQQITATVQPALASGDGPALLSLLNVMPEHALRDHMRRAYLGQTADDSSALEAEAHLLRMMDAEEAAHRGYAVARLAEAALASEEHGGWLSALRSRLEGPLAEVVCSEGLTGRQLVESWRNDEARGTLIDPPAVWPTNHVDVSDLRRTAVQQLFPAPQLGRPSAELDGWIFLIDQQGTKLLAFDRDGRARWTASTSAGQGTVRVRRGINYVRYVSTFGRLVLMVTEDELTILDALSEAKTPAVLAHERLLPDSSAVAFSGNVIRMRGNAQLLRNRVWLSPYDGQTVAGNVGPLSADCLVFQVGTSLKAVDPYNGSLLWTHDGISPAPGSEILSDERFVVLWPPQTSEVTVYRAADGELLGTRNLPPGIVRPQPDGQWGRCLLTHATERTDAGAESRIGLYDPAHDEMVWERTFVDATPPAVVDGQDLCVIQQDGTLTILDGMTGAGLVSSRIPPELSPERVTVQADGDRYFVATYATPQTGNPRTDKRILPIQQPPLPVVHGAVMAISREDGQLLWSRPVEYQQWQIDLPRGWPVLTFAAEVQDPNPGANGRSAGRHVSLLLLDKKTGQPRYEKETEKNERIQKRGWMSMPEKNELMIVLGNTTISMKFSEQPPAEEEAESEPVETPK